MKSDYLIALVAALGLSASAVSAENPEMTGATGYLTNWSSMLVADTALDLDQLTALGNAIYSLPWIEMALNPAASQKPNVKCPGADVTVKSTGTFLPLGDRRATATGLGQLVPYDYEMDEDLTSLTIRARGMPRAAHIFRKAG